MKTLILTDIFGKESIPSKLKTTNTKILEPYDIRIDGLDEKSLYDNFIKKCGHEKYYEKAYDYISKHKPQQIIGFSAGASVAWRLSELNISSKIVCFYPSQIRNYLHINPINDTTIIFPKKENHFDIEDIKIKLLQKENLEIKNSSALHGFMNEKSKNYDKNEQERYIEFLLSSVFL